MKYKKGVINAEQGGKVVSSPAGKGGERGKYNALYHM